MATNHKVKQADDVLKHAKKIQEISSKVFSQRNSSNQDYQNTQNLVALNSIMNNVVKSTDKAMKGAKLAESRAIARLAAVKKATSQTIKYTSKAKRAALTAKKAAESASITSKKIQRDIHQSKKFQITYRVQVKAAITAAKESEKNAILALKSSKTARAAARIPLEPKQI